MLKRIEGYSATKRASSRLAMKPPLPPPAIHVDAERLQVADHEVGAPVGGRREHAEGDRVHAGDEQGAGLVRDGGDLGGPGLDRAEVAGRFDHHRGGLARDLRPQVGEIDEAGVGIAGDRLDGGEGLGEAPELRAPVGAHGLGHQNATPAGNAAGHQHGAARSRAGVVGRRRDHLHAHQLAHQALELEERLVLAVVGVGAAAVGRQQLAAMDDLVHDRGHVVLGAAGAAEVEPRPGAGPVAGDDLLQVPAQVLLARERRRQVEQPLDPERLRDRGIEVSHVVHADGVEQRPARRRRRIRHIRVGETVAHRLPPARFAGSLSRRRGRTNDARPARLDCPPAAGGPRLRLTRPLGCGVIAQERKGRWQRGRLSGGKGNAGASVCDALLSRHQSERGGSTWASRSTRATTGSFRPR